MIWGIRFLGFRRHVLSSKNPACSWLKRLVISRHFEQGSSAIRTGFIGTWKRFRMNPFAHLRDVFDRISVHPIGCLDDLFPDNWKAAQNSTQNLPA